MKKKGFGKVARLFGLKRMKKKIWKKLKIAKMGRSGC